MQNTKWKKKENEKRNLAKCVLGAQTAKALAAEWRVVGRQICWLLFVKCNPNCGQAGDAAASAAAASAAAVGAAGGAAAAAAAVAATVASIIAAVRKVGQANNKR